MEKSHSKFVGIDTGVRTRVHLVLKIQAGKLKRREGSVPLKNQGGLKTVWYGYLSCFLKGKHTQWMLENNREEL